MVITRTVIGTSDIFSGQLGSARRSRIDDH